MPVTATNDIEVRLLSRSDADVLMRADDDVFDAPVRRDYAKAFLADSNSVIAVALHQDTVVGMASALTYRHPDKPLQMFVNEVGVASAYLRRGIGKALVSCLLEAARELGCTEAWVATEEETIRRVPCTGHWAARAARTVRSFTPSISRIVPDLGPLRSRAALPGHSIRPSGVVRPIASAPLR